MASAASRACSRLSPITAATASPTKRTVPTASACRGGDALGDPSARLKSADDGNGFTWARTRSSPVTIASTPGNAAAAVVSMPRIRACGYGDLRKQTWAWSGEDTSSAKIPAPVRSRSSSTRSTDCPLPNRPYLEALTCSHFRRLTTHRGFYPGPDAVDEIAERPAIVLFDETMNVGVESGELLVEAARELQELHDGAVEPLAGNQQRDARWVRRQEDARHAAFELIDLDAVDLTMRHAGKGVRGLHRRLHVGQIHYRRHPRDVVRLVHVVDLPAQVAQAHALVGGLLRAELGKDLPQRLVLVVVVLELLQRGHQRVPPTLGDADGEHDEKRVQAGLLDDHAVLGEVLGDDRRRDAGLGKSARDVEPRRDHRGLDRVEHVEAGREVAEAVPLLVGAKHPVVALAHALGCQFFGPPDLEPPILAPFVVDFAHRAAEVERLGDGLL